MGDRADPAWLQQARDAWAHRGRARPPFALEPGPGQESVWDYPRPPTLVPDARCVEARDDAGAVLARSTGSFRVLETASPPTFYLPPGDVHMERLVATSGRSVCEWKGAASYLALRGTERAVAWCYPEPLSSFADLAGWVAFYPGRISCTVDGEAVRPQAGNFYGGWITGEIVGPFKGEPGTEGW